MILMLFFLFYFFVCENDSAFIAMPVLFVILFVITGFLFAILSSVNIF